MKHKLIQAVGGLTHYKAQTAVVVVVLTLATGLIVNPVSPTGRKSRGGRWTASTLMISQF